MMCLQSLGSKNSSGRVAAAGICEGFGVWSHAPRDSLHSAAAAGMLDDSNDSITLGTHPSTRFYCEMLPPHVENWSRAPGAILQGGLSCRGGGVRRPGLGLVGVVPREHKEVPVAVARNAGVGVEVGGV